jgi:hypothetical protein
MTKSKKKVTASEFDSMAESGKDVSEFFDEDSGTKRFNIDLPIWALRELDSEANRRGIARQALVKGWIIDRLDQIRRDGASRVAAG